MEFDSIADNIQIQRLKTMGAVMDPKCLDGTDHKRLPTSFVRAWKDKELLVKLTRVWLR